jgi:hypothetical protein
VISMTNISSLICPPQCAMTVHVTTPSSSFIHCHFKFNSQYFYL